MPIISFPASYRTSLELLTKLVAESPLDGKNQNEVLWSFDVIQLWEEWFTARYGELRELRHRSNPDDPPDLDLIFESGDVGLEYTELKPHPLGHAEAIAAKINAGHGRILPSLSRKWSRQELQRLATCSVAGVNAWASVSDDDKVGFETLLTTIRRKMANPTSQIICVRDETTLDEPTLAAVNIELFAFRLLDALDSEDFKKSDDRTVILIRPDKSLSALLQRGHPLQAKRHGKLVCELD